MHSLNKRRGIPGHSKDVSAEQIRLLYQGVPLAMVATLINAVAIAIVQWPVIDHGVIIGWLAILTVISVSRIGLALRFNAVNPDSHAIAIWGRWFLAGTWAAAIVWGGATILLFPENNIPHQAFLAFVVAGMSAGAVTTLSADLRAAIPYVLISVTPLVGHFLWHATPMSVAMAVMVVLFILVVASSARRINQNITQNITLRLQAADRENALSEKERDLRTVFNSVYDAIFICTLDGRLMEANRRAEMLLSKYAEHTARTDQFHKLLSEDDQAGLARIWQDARQGTERLFEAALRGTQANHVVYLEVFLRRVRMGKEDVIIANMRDISERRRVEAMKNEFISTVSHELRTPLTSIRGSLGLLQGGAAGDLPETAQPLIDIAARNSERLSLLINDLLDFEKIMSGGMEHKNENQLLAPLVERAIEDNAGFARQYHVHFQLQNNCPDARVNIDGARMLQVMTNLLSNAVKFSGDAKQVDITIDGDEQIRISVRDYGEGIPEEFRDRIFTKFSQADASNTRNQGGTGLGLAISKSLVEAMNGAIGYESQPGQGALFYVTLPRAS